MDNQNDPKSSEPVNHDSNNELASNASSDSGVPWQLHALTEALGDLVLSVNDSLSIGRGQDNDVVLGSKQISRNHALLSVLNGKLYLKDLASSNGTFINNEPIEANKSQQVNDDDKVSFASFSFQVIAPHIQTAALTPAPEASEAPVTGNDPVATNPEATTEAGQSVTSSTESNATEKPQLQSEESAPLESVLPPETPAAESTPVADSTQPPVQPLQPNVEEREEVQQKEVQQKIVAEPKAVTASATPASDVFRTNEKANEDEVAKSAQSATAPVSPIADSTPEPESQSTAKPQAQSSKEGTMSNNDPHDKTTTTELQKEADPEVLKAKQAATAQFSGTANLGEKKDLGTQGNNAMDQALNNPATHPTANKKPSGSWFIWLFIGLIVLGIALWMFNMGGGGAA